MEKFSKQTPIDGKLPNDGSGELVLYRRISQDEIWNYILRTRTPEAIRKYLDLYPDAIPQKATILEEIKADDALWEEVLKRGTPDDLAISQNIPMDGNSEAKSGLYRQLLVTVSGKKRKCWSSEQSRRTGAYPMKYR